MQVSLALSSVEAAREPHRYGHICHDGKWYAPHLDDKPTCVPLRHLNTAVTEITALGSAVHNAAHDTPTMVAVMEGMTGFDAEELGDEERDGWVRAARLATETLAARLDGITS